MEGLQIQKRWQIVLAVTIRMLGFDFRIRIIVWRHGAGVKPGSTLRRYGPVVTSSLCTARQKTAVQANVIGPGGREAVPAVLLNVSMVRGLKMLLIAHHLFIRPKVCSLLIIIE